jgi:hypothetical protein
MCSLDDGERCEVWRETERRARKAHTCGSCGARIPAGDSYVRHFSVFDGDVCDVAVCSPCRSARAEFQAAHGAVLTPDMTMEMFHECLDSFGPEDCTPAERRAWVARRDPYEARWRVLLAAMKRRCWRAGGREQAIARRREVAAGRAERARGVA